MKIINVKTFFIYLLSFISLLIYPVEIKAKQKSGLDFLVIGAQKAGTTTLRTYLDQHPLILAQREIHFFDNKFHLGKNWYEKRLPKRPNDQYLIGEKTPSYLLHPAIPKRVYSFYPKIKLIAVLRNPVDRAYSNYWHNICANRENLSFAEAIQAEFSRIKGEREKLMKDPSHSCRKYMDSTYLTRGIYVRQIKNWLKFFPKEQMLIISSDELYKYPKIAMEKVYAFLGVPNQEPQENLITNKHFIYPPMPLEMRQYLDAYFHPYNEKLEKLLDQKFNWNTGPSDKDYLTNILPNNPLK